MAARVRYSQYETRAVRNRQETTLYDRQGESEYLCCDTSSCFHISGMALQTRYGLLQ